MRFTMTSKLFPVVAALLAAGLAPNLRLNHRSVAVLRDADKFIVWEVVRLRSDLIAVHFNDVDSDRFRRPAFFGELDAAVAWLKSVIAGGVPLTEVTG